MDLFSEFWDGTDIRAVFAADDDVGIQRFGGRGEDVQAVGAG